jgi:hypothetical protein
VIELRIFPVCLERFVGVAIAIVVNAVARFDGRHLARAGPPGLAAANIHAGTGAGLGHVVRTRLARGYWIVVWHVVAIVVQAVAYLDRWFVCSAYRPSRVLVACFKTEAGANIGRLTDAWPIFTIADHTTRTRAVLRLALPAGQSAGQCRINAFVTVRTKGHRALAPAESAFRKRPTDSIATLGIRQTRLAQINARWRAHRPDVRAYLHRTAEPAIRTLRDTRSGTNEANFSLDAKFGIAIIACKALRTKTAGRDVPGDIDGDCIDRNNTVVNQNIVDDAIPTGDIRSPVDLRQIPADGVNQGVVLQPAYHIKGRRPLAITA